MPRRLISTGSPLEKTVGYSRAVIDGDFAFVAGTTGYDYATMTMPDDVTSQSRNCFKTIEAALKEGGFAMADIVRATYYITDAKDADAHFAVCGEVLGDAPYYARFGFSGDETGELSLPGPFERDRLLGLELRDGALDGALGMIAATGKAAVPKTRAARAKALRTVTHAA